MTNSAAEIVKAHLNAFHISVSVTTRYKIYLRWTLVLTLDEQWFWYILGSQVYDQFSNFRFFDSAVPQDHLTTLQEMYQGKFEVDCYKWKILLKIIIVYHNICNTYCIYIIICVIFYGKVSSHAIFLHTNPYLEFPSYSNMNIKIKWDARPHDRIITVLSLCGCIIWKH